MKDISVLFEAPTPEEYVAMRQVAGLQGRRLTSAKKGLAKSIFWVTLRQGDRLVGMGRVIGDGTTAVQITDVAIHPKFQRAGCGKMIMKEIQRFIEEKVPEDAFVCLFTGNEIVPFYKNLGFEPTEPSLIGMQWLRSSSK